MTKIVTTYATPSADEAGYLSATTGEQPACEYDAVSGFVLLHFTHPNAPVAAECYRQDLRLQTILAAKRKVYGEIKRCVERERGKR